MTVVKSDRDQFEEFCQPFGYGCTAEQQGSRDPAAHSRQAGL